MSKLERILQASGGNIDESMGAGRTPRPLPGATSAQAGPMSARLAGLVRSKDAAEIPVDRIDRDPGQPREEFSEEALERLAASMKARGQIQPIRVSWDEDRGLYVIICGERRWRAAKMAGLPTLTCIIAERPSDPGDLLALQLIENAVREDLSPLEQARAYRSLMETQGWSARQLAAELAINPATVTRATSLLELPAPVQDRVEQGTLPPATAYEIGKVEDRAVQVELAEAAVSEGLNRSEVGEMVRAIKSRRPAPGRLPDPVTVEVEPGVVVSVRWRKAAPVTAAQALRKALKAVQDLERGRGDEAA